MTEPTTHNEPDAVALSRRWLHAKAVEARATRDRIAIETALLPFVEKKAEGTITTELVDGTKVAVTTRINRKVNFKAWAALKADIPENLRPFKLKEVLDEVGLRWLQNNEPELYAKLAAVIEATPGKPTIAITPPAEAA